MSPALMDVLDVEGWAAMLFVRAEGADTLEEAPPGMDVDDERVLRREQWIVAGDQYIFVTREPGGPWTAPKLGEVPEEEDEPYPSCLEDLLPLAERALAAGQRVHPVLLAEVAVERVRPMFLGHTMTEELRAALATMLALRIAELCPTADWRVGVDVVFDRRRCSCEVRPRVFRPLRKLHAIKITIVP